MRFAIIMAVPLCISGCSSPDERAQVEIMNDIESKVQLPPRAEMLEYYARAYTFASSTRVAGYYFRADDDQDLGACESAKSYGADNGQILLMCPPPDGMKRNERRWLGSGTLLPSVEDGGCDYIEVEYDLTTKKVTAVNCNGLA